MKKTLGYIFLVMAVLMAIILLLMIPNIAILLTDLWDVMTNETEGYYTGYVLGRIGLWITFIGILVTLWIYGRKWTKKAQPISINHDVFD